jgi:UDP-N-acetylglucosamine 2-epimerase (non-hydrolysing)
MKTLRIHLVAGARPNFMKIAPLYHALKAKSWAVPVIVHTDQHYDQNMSGNFFREFGLPTPNYSLGVGSGTHGDQTARIMSAYEKVVVEDKPNLVVVVGDVNSTIAAALVATKLWVPVAHLEAGLRSRDRSMPEEINRLATDAICDVLWTSAPEGDENLAKEGMGPDKVEQVGNIMLDSFEMMRDKITKETAREDLNLEAGSYCVMTIHRPSNVDSPEQLAKVANVMEEIAKKMPIVYPMHPRTKKMLEQGGLLSKIENNKNIKLVEPQPYLRFMNLLTGCRLAVTDSGGLQEETSYLGIPCLTLRATTERPVTVKLGTNKLSTLDKVLEDVDEVLSRPIGAASKIPFWDGKTASRVVASIERRWLA